MLFHRIRVNSIHVIVLSVLALCLMAPEVGDSAYAQDAEPVGQVVRQRGAVTALRAGAPRSLHLGAAVYAGDRIVTDSDARVAVEFRDGSSLTVGSDTQVEVSAYVQEDQEGGVLTLLLGIIRIGLSDAWRSGFEVRTRAAVAAVRSTDWVIEAREDRTAVFVVAGQVAVTGAVGDTGVVLTEGFGTDVMYGQAPTPPKQWGLSRVEEVLARTRVP